MLRHSRKRDFVCNQLYLPRQGRLNIVSCLSVKGVMTATRRDRSELPRPNRRSFRIAAKSATFCKSHTGYHGDKKNDSKDVSILKHASLVQFEGFWVDDVVDEEQVAESFRFRMTDTERLVEV